MDKNKIAVTTYDKIADIYTKRYFDGLSDAPHIDRLLSKLSPGSLILDAGCGPGTFYLYIQNKGFKVIGIDYSREMILKARKIVPEGTFRYMDMTDLNFKDGSFDAILAAYSLIHIPSEDIPKTLEGFHRVLKPGGYLQIIVQKGKPDQIIDEPFMPSEKMFFNFFSKSRLADFVKNTGFRIDSIIEAPSQDPDSVGSSIIYTIAQKI